MGFPMPIAMTTLGRLGKDHMFVWAWGVNGCFSVIGAAAAPVIATNFGLAAVIEVAGFAYLLAIPAFYGVIASEREQGPDIVRRGGVIPVVDLTVRRVCAANLTSRRHITILQQINDAACVHQPLTKNS